MKKFVFLNLLLFINSLTIGIFTDHFKPSTIFFMFLFWRMTTTTTERIMFHHYSLFSLNKSLHNLLAIENITIKMLTEYLCSLILNSIFRLNCNYVTNTQFEKCFANFLRITWIDKDDLWQTLNTWAKYLNDLFRTNDLKST